MLDAGLRERLVTDTPFYGRHCVKIVNKAGQLVPLAARPSQQKLEDALRRQRDAGQLERAIVLKSRKTGVSTWVQAKALQRTTQIAYYKALTVAQDGKTSSELISMIEDVMYPNLPTSAELALKPVIRAMRSRTSMIFGEPSREARRRGHVGLNSEMSVQTAREVEAGRGFTVHFLHLSEVAFYAQTRKLVAVINAVPDEPGTCIIKESTGNGENHFKDDWEAAEDGRSDYAAVFIGWLEDPDCWRAFANDAERHEFAEQLGQGPYGEEEPDLVELGASLEQLHWRRWAIANKAEGSLDIFHQEYPVTPEQAFLSTGRTVFDKRHIARVKRAVQTSDPVLPTPDCPGPRVGILRTTATAKRRSRVGMIDVPTGAEFVPREATGFGTRHPWWRMWEEPDPGYRPKDGESRDLWRPPARYIVTVDPMSGEEEETADPGNQLAWHAIVVINHRTLEQVASYRSRVDPDLVALEAMQAGLYFNEALLVVEVTGGYGWPIARRWWSDYHYRRVYMRHRQDDKKESQLERLGFETRRDTRPMLEAGAAELLRQERDGIRSRNLASEVGSYVRDKVGRTGHAPGRHDDELMAWMIAQHVARELPPPRDRRPGKRYTSTTRGILHPQTGY